MIELIAADCEEREKEDVDESEEKDNTESEKEDVNKSEPEDIDESEVYDYTERKKDIDKIEENDVDESKKEKDVDESKEEDVDESREEKVVDESMEEKDVDESKEKDIDESMEEKVVDESMEEKVVDESMEEKVVDESMEEKVVDESKEKDIDESKEKDVDESKEEKDADESKEKNDVDVSEVEKDIKKSLEDIDESKEEKDSCESKEKKVRVVEKSKKDDADESEEDDADESEEDDADECEEEDVDESEEEDVDESEEEDADDTGNKKKKLTINTDLTGLFSSVKQDYRPEVFRDIERRMVWPIVRSKLVMHSIWKTWVESGFIEGVLYDDEEYSTKEMRPEYCKDVVYFTEEGLKESQVFVVNGVIYDKNATPYTCTSTYSPYKNNKNKEDIRNMIIMDMLGNTFIFPKTIGVHQHSTFFSARPASFAGIIYLKKGIIDRVSTSSGHYLTSDTELDNWNRKHGKVYRLKYNFDFSSQLFCQPQPGTLVEYIHLINNESTDDERNIVELLLKGGIDVNEKALGFISIVEAAKKNDSLMVALLLKYNANPKPVFDEICNLSGVCNKEQLKLIELYLKSDEHSRELIDKSPHLLAAVNNTDSSLADLLVQYGANPKAVLDDSLNQTCTYNHNQLQIRIISNYLESSEYLRDKTSINIDEYFIAAARCFNKALSDVFLNHGASIKSILKCIALQNRSLSGTELEYIDVYLSSQEFTNDGGIAQFDRPFLILLARTGNYTFLNTILKLGVQPVMLDFISFIMGKSTYVDREVISTFLKNGADVEERDPIDGNTALMMALRNSDDNLVTLLIKHGANVLAGNNYLNMSAIDYINESELYFDSGYKFCTIIKPLFREPHEHSLLLLKYISYFHEYAWVSNPTDLKIIEWFLTSGADLESRNKKNGTTAIMMAISNADQPLVDLLKKYGAEIDVSILSDIYYTTLANNTPSTIEQQCAIQNLFETFSASYRNTFFHRETLLCLARLGDCKLISVFLKYGAPSVMLEFVSTLVMPCTNSDLAVIRNFLVNGANIEERDPVDGNTALMMAARKGDDALVRLLIEHGANVMAGRNYHNMSVLDYAALNIDKWKSNIIKSEIECCLKFVSYFEKSKMYSIFISSIIIYCLISLLKDSNMRGCKNDYDIIKSFADIRRSGNNLVDIYSIEYLHQSSDVNLDLYMIVLYTCVKYVNADFLHFKEVSSNRTSFSKLEYENSVLRVYFSLSLYVCNFRDKQHTVLNSLYRDLPDLDVNFDYLLDWALDNNIHNLAEMVSKFAGNSKRGFDRIVNRKEYCSFSNKELNLVKIYLDSSGFQQEGGMAHINASMLKIALSENYLLVELLLKYGARPILLEYVSCFSHPGCRFSSIYIVKMFLNNGANIEERDPVDGNTALMMAARKGDDTLVRLLIEHGANVMAGRNYHNMSVLDYAVLNIDKWKSDIVKSEIECCLKLESYFENTSLSWNSLAQSSLIIMREYELLNTSLGVEVVLHFIRYLNTLSTTSLDGFSDLGALINAYSNYNDFPGVKQLSSKDKVWSIDEQRTAVLMMQTSLILYNYPNYELTEWNETIMSNILEEAVKHNHDKLATLAIDFGANPRRLVDVCLTIDRHPTQYERDIIDKYLNSEGYRNSVPAIEFKRSTMLEIAMRGDTTFLKLLRKHGAPCIMLEFVSTLTGNNYTDSWVVEELLECGANVDEREIIDGNTALMMAARNGHLDIMNILIKHGANIMAGNNYHNTSIFDYLLDFKFKDIYVNKFLTSEIEACIQFRLLFSDLRVSSFSQILVGYLRVLEKKSLEVCSGDLKILENLLVGGANADARDEHTGRTVLMMAVILANNDLVLLLLKFGANPFAGCDLSNKTALDYAFEKLELKVDTISKMLQPL